MNKKILTGLVLACISTFSFAESDVVENSNKDQEIKIVYEDLKLGDIPHIKLISDFGRVKTSGKHESHENDDLYKSLKNYYESLSVSGNDEKELALMKMTIDAITKLDSEMKLLDIRNKMYDENKKVIFVNTDIDKFSNECFNTVYGVFNTCFEYGYGKVINITSYEEKENAKFADKSVEAIIDDLKSSGFKKDGDYYVKDDIKVKVKSSGSKIETTTTKKSLEEFKKEMIEDSKEVNSVKTVKTVKSHLKYAK